jgi:hypothetical protein
MICHDCGCGKGEGEFLPKRRGQPRLCADGIAEHERAVLRGPLKPSDRIRTRASYRAALRHRQRSPQLDLVDALVPSP